MEQQKVQLFMVASMLVLPIIIMEIQKKSIKEQTVKVIMPNSGKNLNKIKSAQTKW